MPTAKQNYIKKLNSIAGRYGRLEDATVRRMIAMMNDLRRQIAADLAMAQGWEAFRLRELQRNLTRQIASFQGQLLNVIQDAMMPTHTMGGLSVVEPLEASGIVASAFFQPSQAQLNVLLDFSADLVRGITDDLNRKISTQIRLAALGERTPMDAMRGITDVMGVGRRGPVKGIAYDAERILRTEMQRAFNLAHHSQQQTTARRISGLLKSWVATADSRTRPSHLKAHIKYKKPIPVEEPFILVPEKGKRRGQRFKLMYPGDPSAPPELTINCRCRSVTVHPALGRVGSSLDGRISKELERRNGR